MNSGQVRANGQSEARSRGQDSYALFKDQAKKVKDRAVAAYVATQVLSLEVLDDGGAPSDGKPAFVTTACGDRFCRAQERGRPAGWRCSREGAGFSCLCGHHSSDTIGMVQTALGLKFFDALKQLDHALPQRSVRTDRAGCDDLFGAPAPCEQELGLRGKRP
jgi:hypothetical protein